MPPLQWVAPWHVHGVATPVQVFVTMPPQVLPQLEVSVQQVPISPAPAACGVGVDTEQIRPPPQLQVSPVPSPAKRGKPGFGLVLQGAPGLPLAGGI